jgi:hypothetical protein
MNPWIWQGIAFVICIATYSVANWIGPIASVLPERAIELLLLALGIAMYVARRFARFTYALFEFIVGMFAISIAATNAMGVNSYDPTQRNLFYVSMMGGIYLIVRAIDNLLPELKRIQSS